MLTKPAPCFAFLFHKRFLSFRGINRTKKEIPMADNSSNAPTFTTGEWNGFYLEKHNDNRGWMHLYLEIQDQTIKGEGTDYVGPSPLMVWS